MSYNELVADAVKAGENYRIAGEALINKVNALLKGGVLDALDAGLTTRAILAGELKINAATLGYNELVWRCAALDDDGTPVTALYTAAVAVHKVKAGQGGGYTNGIKAVAECKTRGAALRTLQGIVAAGTADPTTATTKGKGKAKTDAELLKAIGSTLKGIKGDGTATKAVIDALVSALNAIKVA